MQIKIKYIYKQTLRLCLNIKEVSIGVDFFANLGLVAKVKRKVAVAAVQYESK